MPKAGAEPWRYVAVEGAPDLIVEIVSDTSVVKDTRRLPAAYFEAGVQEFWLVDARKSEPMFAIHHRGAERFEPTTPDVEGFQFSEVLQCGFQLGWTRGLLGERAFDLRERA